MDLRIKSNSGLDGSVDEPEVDYKRIFEDTLRGRLDAGEFEMSEQDDGTTVMKATSDYGDVTLEIILEGSTPRALRGTTRIQSNDHEVFFRTVTYVDGRIVSYYADSIEINISVLNRSAENALVQKQYLDISDLLPATLAGDQNPFNVRGDYSCADGQITRIKMGNEFVEFVQGRPEIVAFVGGVLKRTATTLPFVASGFELSEHEEVDKETMKSSPGYQILDLEDGSAAWFCQKLPPAYGKIVHDVLASDTWDEGVPRADVFRTYFVKEPEPIA